MMHSRMEAQGRNSQTASMAPMVASALESAMPEPSLAKGGQGIEINMILISSPLLRCVFKSAMLRMQLADGYLSLSALRRALIGSASSTVTTFCFCAADSCSAW